MQHLLCGSLNLYQKVHNFTPKGPLTRARTWAEGVLQVIGPGATVQKLCKRF
jgi:hypothetical protein